MNKKTTTLLIGNDINNINNSKSWSELLKKIVKHLGVTGLVDMNNLGNKPFPLLYEEIFLKGLAKKPQEEVKLKEFIAVLTDQIQHNVIHERIMNLGFTDIMTTNYEYSLQSSAKAKKKNKNEGYINERAYSIFRHHSINKTRMWHIHGECAVPRSITLGYEHYGGFLQHMRNYVATGTDYTGKRNLAPLVLRLEKNNLGDHSWIDFFFTKDIHILGLSLDTSEIDLWWLLTFRARYILQKRRGKKTNTIFYYYPSRFKEKSKDKLELLEANQVRTIEIKEDDKLKYYNSILDRIAK
ncbi:hypothetical protein WSM22_20890 [Cytophagales bacterium WSM2-2]|nr:hypothetical protein WSM22_20890 [Cytophagales bacterium WSM2-2]